MLNHIQRLCVIITLLLPFCNVFTFAQTSASPLTPRGTHKICVPEIDVSVVPLLPLLSESIGENVSGDVVSNDDESDSGSVFTLTPRRAIPESGEPVTSVPENIFIVQKTENVPENVIVLQPAAPLPNAVFEVQASPFEQPATQLTAQPVVLQPIVQQPLPVPQPAASPTVVRQPNQTLESNYVESQLLAIRQELESLKHETYAIRNNTFSQPSSNPNMPKWSAWFFVDSVNVADQSGSSPEVDGTIPNMFGVSNAAISMWGNYRNTFDYCFEIVYRPNANDDINLEDLWFTLPELPLLGQLKFGSMPVESGFSTFQKEKFATLMGSPGQSKAFQAAQCLGAKSVHHSPNKRLRLSLGIYAASVPETRYLTQTNPNQGLVVNSRLTYVPVYRTDSRRLLHLGVNYIYTDPSNHISTLQIKPGAFGTLKIKSPLQFSTLTSACNKIGTEFIWQHESLGIASEVFVNHYSGMNNDRDRTAFGMYIEGRWFITGGNHAYNLEDATQDAPRIQNRHLGGLELVTQWAYTDLTKWKDQDSTGINGYETIAGKQNDITVGLNWYWTSNVHWTLEYVHSRRNLYRKSSPAVTDIVAASFRVNF
ncbi:MAG: hypothetical protein LBU65_14710 [Planctomycetaceae bacterium]|jgi:phosphate-selective porin|nr:hypothetical protein [Planctomycetaceae bacterium]